MSDGCRGCGEEWNHETLRRSNGICSHCTELDITCPLIIIDDTGERVCGEKLIRTGDDYIICPDCEETFKELPEKATKELPKVIYSITLVKLDSAIRTRCVGYYFDRDEAIHAVESNRCDMAELGWYKYAVVSPVHEGIHPIPKDSDQNWFEYDVNLKRFMWIKRPENTKNWAFAGIG